MLDVQAAGSDLAPEQQEETLNDLAFFLDEFGSTRAVRVKLQEQESEIERLKSHLKDEISHQDEEGENTLVNVAEDVDETMTHLDFFLKTFGSTRAVQDMLQRQKKGIVELRRAVQTLQSRGLKSILNGDDIPSEAAMVIEYDTCSHRIHDSNAAVEKPESTARLVRPKGLTICRNPGCSKRVQALGLCYNHGGYHNCKVEGCGRRALTKYLCSYHGGGKRCSVTGCNQRTRPGYKGFCSDHARDQRVVVKRHYNAEECRNDPAKRGYCQTHWVDMEYKSQVEECALQPSVQSLNATKPYDSLSYQHPTNFTQRGSNFTNSTRPHHKQCKVFACKKWAMRNENSIEYCVGHRDATPHDERSRGSLPETMPAFLQGEINPGQGISTAPEDSGGRSVLKFPASLLNDETESNHGNATQLVESENLGGKRKRRGCKEPGCKKLGKDCGPMKGYCFRHGGGITCSHSGCTKARQVRDVCAEHGGFYKCKKEVCTKRAAYRGYCYGHNHERGKLQERIDSRLEIV